MTEWVYEHPYVLMYVQLEKDNVHYSLEVPVDPNKYDQVELAKIYIAVEYDDYGPFHLGNTSEIGWSDDHIIECRRKVYY